MMDRSTLRMLLLVCLLGASACGNLTAGGIGEVVVEVTADETSPVLSPRPAFAASGGAPARSDHDDDDPEGELEVEMRLFLVSENGASVALTDDEIEVQVDLEGIEQDEVANRVVGVGRYTELRLVFLEIEAQVDAGLIINGVPVTGPVEVELEDPPLTVSRALDLEVRPEERTTLLVDLNAASWLQAVDPVTATVDEQVFADLISISVR